MLSSDDATKLHVPIAMYIMKDESVDEVNPTHSTISSPYIDLASFQFNKIKNIISKKPLASKNNLANYKNMFHGFAAARAGMFSHIFSHLTWLIFCLAIDLTNEENKREYESLA